jgi:hypothetical protein
VPNREALESPARRAPLEDSVRRLIRWSIGLYALVIVLIVAAAGGTVYVVNTNHDTRDSLCSLRGDLESRVQQTRDYLEKHPEGFPGVPARQLRDSLRNQERTVDALANLDCG